MCMLHKPAFFSSNNLDHLLLTEAAFCLSKTARQKNKLLQ